MIDAYKFDQEGVATVIDSIKEMTNKYIDKISELNNLINEINNSTAWKDLEVKTTFINTCNSYIKLYNSLIAAMEAFIEYLKNKSNAAISIENTYMGG